MLTVLFGITGYYPELLLAWCNDYLDWLVQYYVDLLCPYRETLMFLAMALGYIASMLFATFILVLLNEKRLSVK